MTYELVTFSSAKDLNPGKSNNLNALCSRYGINTSRRTSHGALLDVELLAEVYLAMEKQKKIRMKGLGGILAGTDYILDQYLLGADEDSKGSYRHKSEALNLKRDLDPEAMLKALLKQIKKNLTARAQDYVCSSKENWRTNIQSNLSNDNDSREIQLERKVAKALKRQKKDDEYSPWWNQMPIASGLVKATADRRRAIDLVHRYGPGGGYMISLNSR